MKILKSFDGTNVAYRQVDGKKNLPTLVFLHGVGGNWTVWRHELEAFEKKGYSTIAIDLRGHGESDSPLPFHKYKHTSFVRDVYEILKKEKITNFSLIGHSLGGGVVITYCSRYKKYFPSSVIFVETPSTYPFQHDHILNFGNYTTHLLRFIARHEATRADHYPHFHDLDLSAKGRKGKYNLIKHLLHVTPLVSIVNTLDNVEEYIFNNQKVIDKTLRDLNVPTLVLAGDLDKTVPLKYSQRIKRLDRDAIYKVIKGGTHHMVIDGPKKVVSSMERFFKKTGNV